MNPEFIALDTLDIALAGALLAASGALSWALRLDLEKKLFIAALRAVVQLSLLGLVLETLFSTRSPLVLALVVLLMVGVAGHEVRSRQQRPLRGAWGYGTGTLSMMLSATAVALFALLTMLQPEPWHHPRYLIPLVGMLLGNTLTGVAVALDTLGREAWNRRDEIEARLMLGEDAPSAFSAIRRDALRAGMVPLLNGMATAGVVSLPGMMTGQILAGGDPMQAARYQILILFLIGAGTALGATLAVLLAGRRLFDERQRLRLDRLA